MDDIERDEFSGSCTKFGREKSVFIFMSNLNSLAIDSHFTSIRCSTTSIAAMACPKCTMRLIRQSKRPRVSFPPSSRAFHTSPARQRLGAFTYAQEWQTGTYHYNKALAKTLPVAAQRVDELLTNYATQQRRHIDPSNPLYAQLTRQSIAFERRQQDRILIGKTTAKEYVDRVELTAFLFDGAEAAKEEKAAFLEKLKARKEAQGQGAGGNNKRGPAARRRAPGSMGPGSAIPGARRTGGAGMQRRAPGSINMGRAMRGGPSGGASRPGGFSAASGGGTTTRRLPGIGAGAQKPPAGQPNASKPSARS